MASRKRVLIIGAGTAGTVIFNDLKKYFDVVALEQSAIKNIPFYFKIPIAIGVLFSKDNRYVTKFTINSNENRPIPFFKSNCLGGASVINGSVHVTGSLKAWKRVFNKFALDFGDFFKLYNSSFTKKNDRLKVKLRQQLPDELDTAFFKSLRTFSVATRDSEFFSGSSCGPIFNTTKNFFRSSVLDFSSKSSIATRLSSTVTDIEVNDGHVKGVWVGNKFIHADMVIVSAGVAGTGKLLCRLSNKLSKDTHKEIKGIKDHTNIRINVKAKRDLFSLNQIALPFHRRIAFIFKNRNRLISIGRGSGASSAANIDLYGDGDVSLRINLLRFHESGRLGSLGRLFDNCDHGFSLSLTQINPVSNGYIDANGNINPGYLSDDKDVEFLKDALHYAVKLLQTPPLSDYVEEIISYKEMMAEPDNYIKKNFYSGYHLIGGAADLVDSDFQHKEVKGVYICDASVLSEYPTSNIHSSVVLLAKAFSKKILDKFSR